MKDIKRWSKSMPTGTAAEHGDIAEDGVPPANKVICACANMTFARLEAAVDKVHSHGFDALLKETGAGRTCTACLLDLEYYFVALKAREDHRQSTRSTVGVAEIPVQRPWKNRAYDWFDSISPAVAWASPNRVPIVSGAGIETWLTVTNHDLLFDQRRSAPLSTDVDVRRADGTRIWRRRFQILPGEELRVRLDEGVRTGDEELSVGSACVISRAAYPAMRGTMRPQLEILASRGACALHAQGDVGPGDTWFTVQNRPADERLFLVLVNTNGRGQTAEISFPHVAGFTPAQDSAVSITLPPHGTGLHEIQLAPEATARIGDQPFAVRTHCPRACRVYLVCATPELDRFSIDHR